MVDMQEIGVNGVALQLILAGRKTIEGRLAKKRFVDLSVGEHIVLREDTWQNGKITKSVSTKNELVITKINRFASFREMLDAVGYRNAVPTARTIEQAVAKYRQIYSLADEKGLGVVAISFKLVK